MGQKRLQTLNPLLEQRFRMDDDQGALLQFADEICRDNGFTEPRRGIEYSVLMSKESRNRNLLIASQCSAECPLYYPFIHSPVINRDFRTDA